ncbi:hypothetical protein B0H11DRAFT_2364842 [Mycena galericulata]|nr:hypothetical protein B0H11DRAFT_2364842 [Mycena galericulata]
MTSRKPSIHRIISHNSSPELVVPIHAAKRGRPRKRQNPQSFSSSEASAQPVPSGLNMESSEPVGQLTLEEPALFTQQPLCTFSPFRAEASSDPLPPQPIPTVDDTHTDLCLNTPEPGDATPRQRDLPLITALASVAPLFDPFDQSTAPVPASDSQHSMAYAKNFRQSTEHSLLLYAESDEELERAPITIASSTNTAAHNNLPILPRPIGEDKPWAFLYPNPLHRYDDYIVLSDVVIGHPPVSLFTLKLPLTITGVEQIMVKVTEDDHGDCIFEAISSPHAQLLIGQSVTFCGEVQGTWRVETAVKYREGYAYLLCHDYDHCLGTYVRVIQSEFHMPATYNSLNNAGYSGASTTFM